MVGVASTRPQLAKYSYALATAEEVTDRPASFRLLDTDVVLYRDRQGDPVAFRDLCIHRGTRLSLGEVTEDGNLRCTYHGWEYAPDGRCVRIPSLPNEATIPSKARAFVYHAREAYGLVWVALDEPCAGIPEFPNDEWDDAARRNIRTIDQTWSSSAGRAIENFCDWAHLPWLHSDRLGSRDRAVVQPYDVWSSDTQLGFTIDEQTASADAYAEGICRNTFVITLPFTVHFLRRRMDEVDPHVTIMMTACPISAKSCRVLVLNSRNHDLDPGADAAFTAFTERIFEEDRVVIESAKPEEIPIDLREELHLKVSDAFSIVYRRLLADYGEEGDAYLNL